jgi:L-alanine-DL-glutamate epimerase-like enolase superfamily enzyme
MHARDRGLAVVPHCWKSAIGIAASAHLAAVAPTCTYIEFLPSELSDSALRRDLCSVELPVVDGRIPLPDAPGLGVTLDEAMLQRFKVV